MEALNEMQSKINVIAKGINHFCSVLYEYCVRLDMDIANITSKRDAKQHDIAILQEELKGLEEKLSMAKINQSETKAILMDKYHLDVDALETEEKL